MKIEHEPSSWLHYHRREARRRIAYMFRVHHANGNTEAMSPVKRNIIDDECKAIANIEAELKRRGEPVS